MTTGEIFAVFASGVAVATSLGSICIALTALLRDRAHLKVEAAIAYVIPSVQEMIQLTVINDGRHAEVVSSLGFQTSDERQVLFIRPENFPSGQLPWRLEPNTSNLAIIPVQVLREQWANENLGDVVYSFARTQSGRIYRDRPARTVVDMIR